MCGRYTLQRAEKALGRVIPQDEWESIWEGKWIHHRFNVAPTQHMPIVLSKGGRRAPAVMRWGFVPFYEREKPKPQALINARSETIATKAPFKRATQSQRCLVPADGFFEWKREGERKTPFYFTLRDEEPFVIAGLWESAGGNAAEGYLLLTTAPNELMASIHDRMPVILHPEAWDEWLAPEPLSAERLAQLCTAYPAEEMSARPVSALVNSARNDSPEILTAPATAEEEMPKKIARGDLSGQAELF